MTKDKQSKNYKNQNIKKIKQKILPRKDDDEDFLDQMILQNIIGKDSINLKTDHIAVESHWSSILGRPTLSNLQYQLIQTNNRFSDNSEFNNLKDWEEKPWKQTQPPTVTVPKQFPDGKYPIGSEQAYLGDKSVRITSEEMRLKDQIHEDQLQSLKKAAECHRQVRQYAQKSLIKPGKKLIDICESLEDMNRYLVEENNLKAGVASPTGGSLNFCTAHYTPNPGDQNVLGYDDVCKIDFGTQVDGWIIDCAFTVAFNSIYDTLLQAAQDATEAGIRNAGIDVRFFDVGAAIQEAMESYEVEINGELMRVRQEFV